MRVSLGSQVEDHLHTAILTVALFCSVAASAYSQIPLRPVATEPIGKVRPDSAHAPKKPPRPTTILHRISPKELACPTTTADSVPSLGERIFDEDSVEIGPELLTIGPREYPGTLERAGIGGRVVLQYVIDTLGQPDPCSFVALEATNEAFEGAAFRMVLGSVFRPGENAGKRVPVRVVQGVTFNP